VVRIPVFVEEEGEKPLAGAVLLLGGAILSPRVIGCLLGESKGAAVAVLASNQRGPAGPKEGHLAAVLFNASLQALPIGEHPPEGPFFLHTLPGAQSGARGEDRRQFRGRSSFLLPRWDGTRFKRAVIAEHGSGAPQEFG